MEKDVGRYLRAVVVVLITAFLAVELPHQDKSIFHFIMPTIKLSPGSRLYLDGVLPLVLLLYSYKEVVKSNYFKSGKITIFIIMFFILVPPTFKVMNVVKIPYYMLSGGLKSIDVEESDYTFASGSEGSTIEVELHLRNYGNKAEKLNISIDLPKSLEKIIDEDPIMLPNKYTIHEQQNTLTIQESIPFNYADGYSKEELLDSHYYYDDYKIILSNGEEQLVIVQRGE